MVRLTCDLATQAYAARRCEGKTDLEIRRCLNRYVGREVYRLITAPPTVPAGAELRAARSSAGVSFTIVA